MLTIYEMSIYLTERNFIVNTLTPDAIFYYYNKFMMAQ